MHTLLAAALVALACSQQPAQPAGEAIGSLRGARVAFPMPAERVPLTFLAGPVTDDELARLKELAPNVRVIAGLTRQTAIEHAAGANGADGRLLSAAFLEKAPNLVWVQSPSAGVEWLLAMPAVAGNDGVVLTNMRAAHGPAIADHAFAMLLDLTRQLPYYAEKQRQGEWARDDPPRRPIALQGKTMLVVGIGGIGTEIAQRAHGFGMRVIATRRSDTPAPDYVEKVGKPQDLSGMLPEADVVAICVPLTPETAGMFDAAAFGAMKPGSYLINIARGKVVDADALLAALRSGVLAGACLDVTDPEPLPEGHPLWTAPNVIITPHTAADAEVTDERLRALLRENIRRFGAGEPLLNCVDKAAGY